MLWLIGVRDNRIHIEPVLYKPQKYLYYLEVFIMLWPSVLDLPAVVKNDAMTAVKVNQNISIEVGSSLVWSKLGKVFSNLQYAAYLLPNFNNYW